MHLIRVILCDLHGVLLKLELELLPWLFFLDYLLLIDLVLALLLVVYDGELPGLHLLAELLLVLH